MKKQTPMKRLSDILEKLKEVLYPQFDFSQKNKKAGSPIPYDVREKFNLPHGATTAGIPFDTMYFFRDVHTPYIKCHGNYMPQPGKSIALGFEYNQVDEPVITASTAIVESDHSKTIKAGLPLGVAEMRSRLKAFVEEMKSHQNVGVDAILILFERMVIVTAVGESPQGQEEIAKINKLLAPQKQELVRLSEEHEEINRSLKTAKALAKKEIIKFSSESGIDERIRKLEEQLELLKRERTARYVEIEEKHELNSLERKKQVNEGKAFKINNKIKHVVEAEVESMPIAMQHALKSHFESEKF